MSHSNDDHDNRVNDSYHADVNDDSHFASDGHEVHDAEPTYCHPLVSPYHDANGSAVQAQGDASDDHQDAGRDVQEKTEGGGEAIIGHGEFFDADGDGVFSPLDTFQGFRALGYSFMLSLFSAVIISTMSYASLPAGHWLPDQFFRIYVNGLHKAKHGSDSGSYKRDGRFDEKRFDEFWSSHTDAPHEEITPVQLYYAVAERRLAFDFYGMFAAIFEWFATWLLFGYPSFQFDTKLAYEKIRDLVFETKSDDTKDWKNSLVVDLKMACSGGNVKKEDVKGLYNGTIFYTVMDRQADAGNGWARSWRRKHERTRAMKNLKAMP